MTWPTEQAREAAAQALAGHVRSSSSSCTCGETVPLGLPWLLHRADAVLAALALSVAALVRAERAAVEDERDDLARRLSHLLCDLTRGRMSKTSYDVPTMAREIDAAYEEAWKSERAAVWAEGFAAGYADGTDTGPTGPANPYAEEAGR